MYECDVDAVPSNFENEEIGGIAFWRPGSIPSHWEQPILNCCDVSADLLRAGRGGTMPSMNPVTLATLEAFPRALEAHYAAFPREFVDWAPASWEGVPSEPFTAIEQICHVRDIETEGYQLRFKRTLEGETPLLAYIDSEAITLERDYASADPARVFADLRASRAATLALLRRLGDRELDRRAEFERYGPVTLRGLVHYLCSHDQQHISGLQWLLGKLHAEVPRG
jgi:hypothetical protein